MTGRMKNRLLILAIPALTLAACNSGTEEKGGTASGEVLEGTISDAMLPLDTLTSQPPIATPEPVAGAGSAASDAASESAEEAGAQGSEAAPAAVATAVPAAGE